MEIVSNVSNVSKPVLRYLPPSVNHTVGLLVLIS
jgi:hypothetical protein